MTTMYTVKEENFLSELIQECYLEVRNTCMYYTGYQDMTCADLITFVDVSFSM